MSDINLSANQATIVHTLEGPLFVAAGAGSGKTFTLTQRIRYAMLPGSKPREQWADPDVPEPFLDSIDQVLAITFTDKAATELKERIRKMLIEEGLAEEAAKVDGAWISTIHGMCSRIIRAHALDLGIDPAFELEGYADDLKRLAVEHVLRRVAADDATGTGAYDVLLEAFEIEGAGATHDLASLLDILTAMLSKTAAMVGGLDAFEQVPPKASPQDLYEAYRTIADTPSWKNCDAACDCIAALEAFFASDRGLDAVRACFVATSDLTLPRATKNDDHASEREYVAAVRAARPFFFANAYLAARKDALDELMELAREVQAEYDRLKGERSSLDNDDLLIRAYDALKSDPLVRREFAGRFKMVMVDEFQDTAQQQVELVSLLCSPDARELCTVGDAQQSIYRFRGADVSVFRTKRAEVAHAKAGVLASLDTNFRSHADILEFADRIFWGADNRLGRDFLHLETCGEKDRKNAVALKRPDLTSRRQAILVAGGDADARAREKAARIAERFDALRLTEGFRPGQMVILMKALSKANVYADALRSRGIPCVIAGGTSVFRGAPEVDIVRSLLAFLANPNDGEKGTLPLLLSPMFELGAQELLALTTHVEPVAGIVDSRSLTADTLLDGEIMEKFGALPLLARAREILSKALGRVGRDPVYQIVCDVIDESGWMLRLQRGGAREHAVAANVLKALDIVDAESAGHAYAPRLVADAFAHHIDAIKESPAALNGAGEDAVRIMTIHASKGLEFPVVAIAECDRINAAKDRFQTFERDGRAYWTAYPNRCEQDVDNDIYLAFGKASLDEEMLEGSLPQRAAEAYAYMKEVGRGLEFDELARLLYVAITRAREVVILAMGAQFATELEPGHASSLMGDVLMRILPESDEVPGFPDLGVDMLDFDDAHEGDYSITFLSDFEYPSKSVKGPHIKFLAEDYPALDAAAARDDSFTEEREVTLVYPQEVACSYAPTPTPERDSYSYSSIAATLHAEGEDRGATAASGEDDLAGTAKLAAGDPLALGSAFHAAAQWMIETGSDTVAPERLQALARTWGLEASQRDRLEAALQRWGGSAVRAELLRWPRVLAEVPFFSFGCPDEDIARFGSYAEGAIDALGVDPDDPSRALVIDYKTGGTPDETLEELAVKHGLQARVYADVLHRAGYDSVALRFVRVEQDDPLRPGEPQVVSYEL